MTANSPLQIVLATAASLALPGAAIAGANAPPAANGPTETGIWYDDSGKGAVKVELCGNKLCGRIYWLKNPLNDEGKPLFDRHNPNEGQRNRPICGLQVLGGVANMPDGTWDAGWIYDPKDGKSYSVAIQLADPSTLKVTGYLVMKLMGQTITWKRAPDDLPPCTQNAAAAAPTPAASGQPKPAADAKAAVPAAKPAAQKGAEELPWAEKASKAAPATGASKLGGSQPAQRPARP